MELKRPLKYYCTESDLRFYVLSVGEGSMSVVVFPNNYVLMIDCNVTEDNKDNILNYLNSILPTKLIDDEEKKIIDCFANTHRDDDHIRGIKEINEKYPIKHMWESGQSGDSTESSTYKEFMNLRRKLNDKGELEILTPSKEPVFVNSNVKVYCLSGKNEICETEAFEKKQHTNSLVLKVSYQLTSILFAGDSDWKSWKEKIIPNFEDDVKSEILIASHHGSRSFFTSAENDEIDEDKNPDTTYLESIDKINPDIVLISCGDKKTNHHPNDQALELYEEKSANQQVYTTNDLGNFEGYINNKGEYTVIPAWFDAICSSLGTYVKINCTYIDKDGQKHTVSPGETIFTDVKLTFEITGLPHFVSKYNVEWYVSNGGCTIDSSHQEIYEVESSKNKLLCERNLSYNGKHILMCYIKSPMGSIKKVFIVNGKRL